MKPSMSPSSTARGLPDFIVGPQILDNLVGLKHVRADLVPEADVALFVVFLGVLGLALFLFHSDQLGLQDAAIALLPFLC